MMLDGLLGRPTNCFVDLRPSESGIGHRGMKRDLAPDMMRFVKAASPARRSLMNRSTAPKLLCPISRLRRPVARPALGLDTLLPEATVQQVFEGEGATWKRIVYTPWLIFWAFFWEVLSPDHSCRAVDKRIAAWMGRRGERLDDEETGPYC